MSDHQECVIVFSGGTDSMCVAALKAKEFSKIHLLTYYEFETADEPFPTENVERLRNHYPQVEFLHKCIPTDKLVRHFSYHHYVRNLFKHGLLNMMTPGFSSLSWHVRTLIYCLENNIKECFDGMTNEMIQLPGHMSSVIEKFRGMYEKYNINYQNPVRDWAVPEDQELLDRIIVDQHGFLFPSEERKKVTTTGQYLYEEGIFPHPNVKGSQFDKQMQHDCYQFVLYNILAYWYFMNFTSYEKYSQKVAAFLQEKIEDIHEIITLCQIENRPLENHQLFEKEVDIEGAY